MRVRDMKHLGGADDLNRIQEYIDTALRPALGCPLIDGVLLTDLILANGTTIVEHGLGRKLRGYFIVSRNANATVWDSIATNQHGARTLILHADAVTTVSIWCF